MSSLPGDDEFRPIFSRGPLLVLKLAVLAMLSAGLMVYDQKSELTDPLRDGIAVILAPVHWVSDVPHKLRDVAQHLHSREELIAANDELRHEHLRLNARLQKLVALEVENQRIRALLKSSKRIHQAVRGAQIQAVSLDPYEQRVQIDKGKSAGVEIGQAVIDAHGIMGQVVETTPFASTVVLITDDNQGIPVEIGRNGLQTVAQGRGDNALELPFLPNNADIEVGDLLLSSGLGQRYPEGYPVAYVTKVDHQPGEHFLKVVAVPAAQLAQSRQILLVQRDQVAPSTASLMDPESAPDRVAASR